MNRGFQRTLGCRRTCIPGCAVTIGYHRALAVEDCIIDPANLTEDYAIGCACTKLDARRVRPCRQNSAGFNDVLRGQSGAQHYEHGLDSVAVLLLQAAALLSRLR